MPAPNQDSPNKKTREVITDFGEAEVRKDSDVAVPKFFRPWESAPATNSLGSPKWGKCVRRTATTGYPQFDMFSEWLMDFATISAGQLKRSDWQNYRRMLILHVPDCTLYCWYCFNDAWAGIPGITVGEMDAEEIVGAFSDYAKSEQRKGKAVRILRISGGEPFLQPALIEDVAREFAKLTEPDGTFLWVDTNLHPFGNSPNSAQVSALSALAALGPRVAVHACIHGYNPVTLSRNSCNTTEVANIANALRAFEQVGIPIYPRINPVALSREEVREVFQLLLDTSDKIPFPLRTYLGPVDLNYCHTIDRMRVFQGEPPLHAKDARQAPNGHTKCVPRLMPANVGIFEWNRLLEEHYGVGYARIPRHMTQGISPLPHAQGANAPTAQREWEEVILLCKGWEKEAYAQKLLEILSVPEGSRVVVEFENEWIEPGLLAYASACPTFHEVRETKVLVTACYRKRARQDERAPGLIPVRWAVLKGLSATDYTSRHHSLNFTLEVRGYAIDLQERIAGEKDEGFFERMARYVGLNYLPFASGTSYFCRHVGFEMTKAQMPGKGDPGQDFKRVVIELVKPGYEAAKRDVYFRIKVLEDSATMKSLSFEQGVLKVSEGQEVRLIFEACNPNMDSHGYPDTDHAQIKLATTQADKVSISPACLRLSKYGEPSAQLSFSRVGEYYGEILIEPVFEGIRIPSLKIPFNVEVER